MRKHYSKYSMYGILPAGYIDIIYEEKMWSTGALLRSGTLRIPDLAKKSSTRLDSCCGLPETTPTPFWSQMRLASSEKTWRIKHFYHGGMAHGIKVVEQCVRGMKMNKVRFLQTCRGTKLPHGPCTCHYLGCLVRICLWKKHVIQLSTGLW